MTIQEYVLQHTIRGGCKCGRCLDAGIIPDPAGHTADLVFFKVAKNGEPDLAEFKRLSAEERGAFGDCDPFDGKEHNFMEIGGWIGDQGTALQYMGLGTLLGAFELLTPKIVLGLDGDQAMQLAGMDMLTIKVAKGAG
jgi:hypothetical protein